MPANSRSPAFAWPLAAAAMGLALLAPALWNGFPFIYPDTGGYLARPIEGTLELGRSALYGVFLVAGMTLDFWPVVVAQAALTIWLIAVTLRAHGLGRRPWLALVAMLSVATSMPWFAGQLIPDMFVAAAVLALHLLAYRASALNRGERLALAAVVAVAIASHMGTLALCVALAAAIWLARLLPLHLPRPRLTLAGITIAAGIALAPLSNLAITGKFAFTPGGESFLFGRLVQDGIVARYLAQRCPDAKIKLCAYAATMPTTADDWLWAPDTPLNKLGGWRGYADEERRIIRDTLLLYPGGHLITAIRATLDQLLSFKTDVSVNPGYNAPALQQLGELTPGLMPRLLAARQQARPFDLDALNMLHVPFAALACAGLIAVALFGRRLNVAPRTLALNFSLLTALIFNAAICGVFSNPVDRYQSRLIWLAPLALAIAVLDRRGRGHLGLAPEFP